MQLLNLTLYFVLCTLSVGCNIHVKNVKGYYWRDFTETIPDDAVIGGFDTKGRIIYIGQTLHEGSGGKIIPGSIISGEKKITYAWDYKHFEATRNVKILCSQHPSFFKWTETSTADLESKPLPKGLVIGGGYSTSYPTYIGRIHTEGQIVPGKVTMPPPDNYLGFTLNGTAHYVKSGFSILSYEDPSDSNSSTCVSEPNKSGKTINIIVN